MKLRDAQLGRIEAEAWFARAFDVRREASASTVVDAARCAAKGPVLGWIDANERPGRPVKTQEMNDTLETSVYTGRLREGSIAPLGRS